MAELDRAAISVRLAQSRELAGLKQPDMAELLLREDVPLHYRSIQNYESPKKSVIPWDLLDQWAKITGTTKEWLLHGDQEIGATVEELQELRGDVAELRAAVDRMLALLLARAEPPADAEHP